MLKANCVGKKLLTLHVHKLESAVISAACLTKQVKLSSSGAPPTYNFTRTWYGAVRVTGEGVFGEDKLIQGPGVLIA